MWGHCKTWEIEPLSEPGVGRRCNKGFERLVGGVLLVIVILTRWRRNKRLQIFVCSSVGIFKGLPHGRLPFRVILVPSQLCLAVGLVTNSVIISWPLKFKKVCFLQTHNRSLTRWYLTVSWDLFCLEWHIWQCSTCILVNTEATCKVQGSKTETNEVDRSNEIEQFPSPFKQINDIFQKKGQTE